MGLFIFWDAHFFSVAQMFRSVLKELEREEMK